MNPFPEVFCKGGPSLRSRIAQMRYLGTLPDTEEVTGFDQKQVQTSPAATFERGFGLSQPGAVAGFQQMPVIKIPSPPLLRGGLLTKVAYQARSLVNESNTHRSQTSRPGPKAVVLKSRSPSPAVAKTAETSAKRPIRRPESTPIDCPDLPTSLQSSVMDSQAMARPRNVLNLSLPAKLLAGLATPQPFTRYLLGTSTLSPRLKTLLSESPILGHALEDSERKVSLKTALKDVFGREDFLTGRIAAYHHCVSRDYYLIRLGEAVPLSLCCSSVILAQFSCSSEGRLLCTGPCCSHRTLHTFYLSGKTCDLLWGKEQGLSEEVSKAISRQIQTGSYRSRSLRTEARSRKEEAIPSKKHRNWRGIQQGNRPPLTILTHTRGYRFRLKVDLKTYRRSSDSPVYRSVFPSNPLSSSILA